MSEQAELDKCLEEFTKAMKQRLSSKRRQGWKGWNVKSHYEDSAKRMLKNAAVGFSMGDNKSLVDTACFAMFLWNQVPK